MPIIGKSNKYRVQVDFTRLLIETCGEKKTTLQEVTPGEITYVEFHSILPDIVAIGGEGFYSAYDLSAKSSQQRLVTAECHGLVTDLRFLDRGSPSEPLELEYTSIGNYKETSAVYIPH